MLLIACSNSMGQSLIENKYYSVQPAANFQQAPAFTVTHKASRIKRSIVPQLQLVYSPTQPELTSSSMDGQPGVVGWKTQSGVTQNISTLGSRDLVAHSYRIKNNQLEFTFSAQPEADVSLLVKFAAGEEAPVFELALQAQQPGHFSLGFTGMPAVDSADIDFVYQPLTWTWKRFPGRFALTEEAYANTAAVFTNHHGYTEGLAVSPADIPYRYALSAQWNNAGKKENKFWSVFPAHGPKANSLFGMAIRNAAGKAQPLIYAPLPGTAYAKLNKGQKHRIGLVYLLCPGDWQKGTAYLLSSIFHYRTERENARVSLNTTFDNMLAFAMNDEYSGWNKNLKASNYQFDVPGTVKNVSALHPLSLAVITGNDTIMRRRALPVIEYVMSREKFLFTTSDTPHQAQAPSRLLKGPCVDIGELTALHTFTRGYTPAFSLEANRLFGKSRQLNMNTETGGGSWQDYLARYRLYRGAADLQKAMEGANTYLQQVYHRYSQTFFDSPGLRDRGAGFTTDYGYRIYDLFELFLETKKEIYLQAAVAGARQLLLWTRSNPSPPAGKIVVNKNNKVEGIFPGRRASAVEGSPFVPMDETTHIPQREIPAWQTSLNGLIPEAPNTYMFGPVMLAHHAAWLLRLAHFSGDTLLRNAAYNAILGRYANFPGYYFTSLHTDVYQHADYPMHPFHDIKYNAIFYNHVWPHLALLADFLVSDFYYRSKGRIDFPGTYAPGYAFLTSQVYGASKGTVMGNSNVQLWMPPRALQSDGIALNYLMGHNEQDVFIAFANTAPRPVTEHITINKTVIPWQAEQTYAMVVYDANGKLTNGTMKNGRLTVTLPANGVGCVQIKGVYPATEKVAAPSVSGKNRFLRFTAMEDSTASATAMVIQPDEQLAVCYVYCNKTEKEWKQCSFRYRLNNEQQWTTITDREYPFEFDLTLGATGDIVTFELTAVRQDGNTIGFPVQTINGDTQQQVIHAQRKGKLSILGLGDSITEGGPAFFSYLFPLDSLLKQAGYQFEFVGPRRAVQKGDTLNHSGFSGKTAEFLAKHIDSIYTAFPADVVLLHAGHNHFSEEAPVAGIIKAQKFIIRSIKKKNPHALALVAAVITSGKLPKYDYIPALGKAIKAMVDSLQDATIIYVDQQQSWDWSRYTIDDKVHPNRTGAGIIAMNWFNAITDTLLPAKELSVRNGLPNFFSKVKTGKPVNIAFLGGSITRAGNGYRDQLLSWLRNEYPSSRFREIMAAVSGTGSDFGACRVQQHVIDHRPDLVFIEFAVNDNHMPTPKVRETMEGIVRQIWKASAKTDICFIYTFSKENLPDLQKGLFPPSVTAMEAIATHYNIPGIHMGLAVVDEITKGKMAITGKKDEAAATPIFSIDGVHPLPETGHKIYTNVLTRCLLQLQQHKIAAVKHKLASALEPKNWSDAGMISSWKHARLTGNWQLTDSVTKGREYYELLPQVYGTAEKDASVTVHFKGTRFGLADIMGPGTAAVEITIDQQPPRVINRFDAFSTYYRLNYFIISDLPPGKHVATVRLAPGAIDKPAILKTRNVTVNNWQPYEKNAMYIGAILY